jgi:uncharacterized membrane protein
MPERKSTDPSKAYEQMISRGVKADTSENPEKSDEAKAPQVESTPTTPNATIHAKIRSFLARYRAHTDADHQRKRQEQINRIKNNPELMQARDEMYQEFLNEHPQLKEMSDEERRKAMQEHTEEDVKISRRKLRNHIEAFSDGVIAVIITIMLLEIPMPTHADGGYWGFLGAVATFLVSFIITANFWFNHHKMLAMTEEMTEGIIVLDFIFLAVLSLVPLLTKWIIVEPNWISSLNYGIVVLLVLWFQEILNYMVTHQHFFKMPKSFKFWKRVWTMRLVFTTVVNIAIMGIAMGFPAMGHWLFIIVPIFNFLFRGVNQGDMDFNLNVEEGRVNGRPQL